MIYCPRCEPEKTMLGWNALLCVYCTERSERANTLDFIGWRIDGQFDADIAVEIVLDVPGDDPARHLRTRPREWRLDRGRNS